MEEAQTSPKGVSDDQSDHIAAGFLPKRLRRDHSRDAIGDWWLSLMIGFPEFVLRIVIAGLCGLLIGLDRRIKNKPLGARAYILIALGAAALMVVMVNFSLSAIANDDSIQIDPAKVVQGIIGGIGFLGGGAIIKDDGNGHLRGAASGAAIWAVGAVGVACGMGYLKEAVFLSALIFAILSLPSWFTSSDPDAQHPDHEGDGPDNG